MYKMNFYQNSDGSGRTDITWNTTVLWVMRFNQQVNQKCQKPQFFVVHTESKTKTGLEVFSKCSAVERITGVNLAKMMSLKTKVQRVDIALKSLSHRSTYLHAFRRELKRSSGSSSS